LTHYLDGSLFQRLKTSRPYIQKAIMQLYRTSAIKKDLAGAPDAPAQTITWQASQTEASKARSALKAMGFKAESQTVNIPTAKGPLIDWLNENVKA
jgi:hypothetical protein